MMTTIKNQQYVASFFLSHKTLLTFLWCPRVYITFLIVSRSPPPYKYTEKWFRRHWEILWQLREIPSNLFNNAFLSPVGFNFRMRITHRHTRPLKFCLELFRWNRFQDIRRAWRRLRCLSILVDFIGTITKFQFQWKTMELIQRIRTFENH